MLPVKNLGVPVLVIGNIAIGGTGKTPLITYLAKRAGELGLRVGIVSRGYGGQSETYPLNVTAETPVSQSGDEPKLLTRTGCPIVVDPKRSRAVQFLKDDVDLVLSDDGLQHYAMARAGEIVVSDVTRGFGNGWQLPIGPLREPISRLNSVDLCLVNGEDFIVQPVALVNANTGEQAKLDTFSNKSVHAIAGIGNPARFFTTLKTLGYMVEEHAFADHHAFVKKDITFSDVLPVVMTEKDWVKCREFSNDNTWFLQVDAQPTADAAQKIDELLIRLGTPAHG
jgi:tetraacyldisaccharide 4'-kinase